MSCQDLGSFRKGARLTARFTWEETFTDEPFDPVSITVITRDPSGDEVTYTEADPEVYQASTPVVGEWFFTFPAGLTEVGWWFLYANGDGGVQEARFRITGVHVTV